MNIEVTLPPNCKLQAKKKIPTITAESERGRPVSETGRGREEKRREEGGRERRERERRERGGFFEFRPLLMVWSKKSGVFVCAVLPRIRHW